MKQLTDASHLSFREKQILGLLAHGLNRIQVADKIHLSQHTVSFHIRNILEKFSATNTTAAVAMAISANLISLSLANSN